MDNNTNTRKAKPKSVNQEELADMIKYYEDGLSTVKIAELYNMKPSTVISRLKRAGVELRSNKINSRRYSLNHDIFSVIDNEQKAYWLGFLYADGFLNKNSNQFGISLSVKDIDHLYKFKEFIQTDAPIYTYKANAKGFSNGDYCRILLSSDSIKNDLIKHGCYTNKTLILDKPNIAKELIPHFIRGYFDGDGCITICHSYKRNYDACKVSFVGTEKLLNFINDWTLDNLNFKMKTLTKRKKDSKVFCLEFYSNKRSKAFLDSIYCNATIYLDRKHQKYIEWFYNNKVELTRNSER